MVIVYLLHLVLQQLLNSGQRQPFTMGNGTNKALEELQLAMGNDVYLLNYLPIHSVRVIEFDDKKGERLNALPYRIHFGQIKRSRFTSSDVGILLHTHQSWGRLPAQRFNLFSRLGKLEGSITIDEAIQKATYAPAFRSIRQGSRIDKTLLRAVIRYYMIAKINLPTLWQVDQLFVSDLLSACRFARNKSTNEARQPRIVLPRGFLQSKDQDSKDAVYKTTERLTCVADIAPHYEPLPSNVRDGSLAARIYNTRAVEEPKRAQNDVPITDLQINSSPELDEHGTGQDAILSRSSEPSAADSVSSDTTGLPHTPPVTPSPDNVVKSVEGLQASPADVPESVDQVSIKKQARHNLSIWIHRN